MADASKTHKNMSQIRTKPLFPNHTEETLRNILKSSPQELWLETIRRTRGPEHDTLVHWMISQTQCDFAVAVHAFFRSDPGQYLDMPRPLPTRPGPSDIFAQLLLNWDTGYYRLDQLAVERQDVDPHLLVRINQKVMARARGSLPFNIPRRFLDPEGGSPSQLAAHLSPDESVHLWPIYSELGLRVHKAPPGLARKLAHVRDFFFRFGVPSRAS